MKTSRRGWRWLLWLLLFVVAALAAGEASGWSFLRGPAESILSARLGREVRLGAPFRLHFRQTIQIELGQLWIAAPPDFAVPHLVDAESLAAGLRYGDLLALRHAEQGLRLATLDVHRLDACLIRLADGRATWQFGPKSVRPPPVVDRLGLRDGQIVLRDATLATDVQATVASPGTAGPAASATIAGTLRRQPLKAQLRLPDGLPLTGGGTGKQSVAAEGTVEYGGLHMEFTGQLAATDDLRGTVVVRGPSLSVLGRLLAVTLPTTDPFHLQAAIVKDSPVWQASVSQARVGSSDLAGEFSYDPRPKPGRLEGELRGRNFVLADLAPAFGTRTPDGGRARPSGGRTLPDRPLDLPALNRLEARIAVKLDRVDLGSAFRQPIAPLRASLKLAGGQLTLSDIDARTAQGRLSGTLSIDAKPKHPEWRAELGWHDIRLDSWLQAAKPSAKEKPSAAGPPAPYFTGTLHGRSQLVGHGNSTAELLASVDGRTTAFVRDGSISHLALEVLGLDVAQGLGLWLRGDDRQPVECVVLDLQARQGRVTPSIGLIATPVTLVVIDGNIDLAHEQLNLRLVAKPQNVSPLTLRSPFRVTGTFAEPQLAPEGGPLAARAAGALALALINPLAAVLPFIDLGEPDSAACSRALTGLRQ